MSAAHAWRPGWRTPPLTETVRCVAPCCWTVMMTMGRVKILSAM